MNPQSPLDISEATKLLSKVLLIVGHSPSEIADHTKTFIQTAIHLLTQKIFVSLPELAQKEMQAKILGTDAKEQQFEKILTIVGEYAPEEKLQQMFDEIVENVLTQYFIQIQPELNPSQTEELKALVA